MEVTFQSHNWPHWGNNVVNDYMVNTAVVYKFINDQTLTYINQGYTSDEISNMIELPEALNRVWYTRQYYGTLSTLPRYSTHFFALSLGVRGFRWTGLLSYQPMNFW